MYALGRRFEALKDLRKSNVIATIIGKTAPHREREDMNKLIYVSTTTLARSIRANEFSSEKVVDVCLQCTRFGWAAACITTREKNYSIT